MTLERHHPNREVDRNLARARDLRSTYLLAWPAAIAEVMACRWPSGEGILRRPSWTCGCLLSTSNPSDRNASGDRRP